MNNITCTPRLTYYWLYACVFYNLYPACVSQKPIDFFETVRFFSVSYHITSVVILGFCAARRDCPNFDTDNNINHYTRTTIYVLVFYSLRITKNRISNRTRSIHVRRVCSFNIIIMKPIRYD